MLQAHRLEQRKGNGVDSYRAQKPHRGSDLSHFFLRALQAAQTCEARDGSPLGDVLDPMARSMSDGENNQMKGACAPGAPSSQLRFGMHTGESIQVTLEVHIIKGSFGNGPLGVAWWCCRGIRGGVDGSGQWQVAPPKMR